MIGLREIRKKKGYSQLKVSLDLNISREALSYYENGRRSPDLELLVSMSKYFGKSIVQNLLDCKKQLRTSSAVNLSIVSFITLKQISMFVRSYMDSKGTKNK